MSRTKYLYNALPDEAGQNAARDMKGPAAEVSELAELYQMSREQSPVFRHYALQLAGKPRQLNLLMVSDGATFWDKLALYRLTGDKARLAEARSLADAYIKARIDTPQRDFSDVHLDRGGQFWSDFAPRFVELFELWQETKEPRYLAAAQTGARAYASYAWYFPRDSRTARSPSIAAASRRSACSPPSRMRKAIRTPEVTLPAWQVSQIGLTPEAQTTYHLNPGIFLAHHAAYELRIAAAANDSFLHDVARAAIVGRYKTFPGYDINVAFSNVYARGDYPEPAVRTPQLQRGLLQPCLAAHRAAHRLSDVGLRDPLEGRHRVPRALCAGLRVSAQQGVWRSSRQVHGRRQRPVVDAAARGPYRRSAGQLSDRLRQWSLLSRAQQRIGERTQRDGDARPRAHSLCPQSKLSRTAVDRRQAGGHDNGGQWHRDAAAVAQGADCHRGRRHARVHAAARRLFRRRATASFQPTKAFEPTRRRWATQPRCSCHSPAGTSSISGRPRRTATSARRDSH